jgi:hypothetical protein
MREALRPGGTLLVLDLRASRGWAERLADVVAAPLSVGLKMIHNRRLRQPAAERDAWAEHGRHDVYPTMAEVRRACAGILPGAKITRHLFWRYSIVWTK